MKRTIRAGIPYLMLVTQYRMHSNIAHVVSFLFYGLTLRSDLSIFNRLAAATFRRWLELVSASCEYQFVFIAVTNEVQLYRETDTKSRVNVDYLSIITFIVTHMFDFDIPAEDIMIITFYSAQRRCYDRWFRQYGIQGLRTSNVNATQNSQSCFIIARFSSRSKIGSPSKIGPSKNRTKAVCRSGALRESFALLKNVFCLLGWTVFKVSKARPRRPSLSKVKRISTFWLLYMIELGRVGKSGRVLEFCTLHDPTRSV